MYFIRLFCLLLLVLLPFSYELQAEEGVPDSSEYYDLRNTNRAPSTKPVYTSNKKKSNKKIAKERKRRGMTFGQMSKRVSKKDKLKKPFPKLDFNGFAETVKRSDKDKTVANTTENVDNWQ